MTALALVRPIVLPELDWQPTRAASSRAGEPIKRVVVHRWGVRYVDSAHEAASYHGVNRFFHDPANQASAHLNFPGSAVPGKATQLVPWDQASWAQADYNHSSIAIETADALWNGHDPRGLHELARIVAYLLHKNGLPVRWSVESGFCRHGDLGAKGGGHTACPTTDQHLWAAFVALVKHEAARGGFRETWGR